MTYDLPGGGATGSNVPAPIHPRDKKRDIVVVVGKTGMGKTQWVRQYIRALKRVIAQDPMQEYEGMVSFETIPELIDHVQEYPAFHVRYEYADQFEMLCKVAWAAQNVTLLIEEAQRVIPPVGELPDIFTDLVYRGRHRRVSLILVAQRAHTIHIAVRSQFTGMVIFRQTERADVKWIQDVSGFDIDPSGLKPLEFYMVKPDEYAKGRISFEGRRPRAIISSSSDTDISDHEERGDT